MPKGNYRRTCRIRRASEAQAAKAREMVQCGCCSSTVERRASFEYHGQVDSYICASCSPIALALLKVLAHQVAGGRGLNNGCMALSLA